VLGGYALKGPEAQIGEWKLHQVTLEDKKLYAEYIKKTTWPVNLWSANFPFIWSYAQSSRRSLFWKIVDDLLVTFMLTKEQKLSLFCLPFGSCDVDRLITVLHKAMRYCSLYNHVRGHYTKIRTVNESQLAYLLTSDKFNKLFALKKLRGMEKHFSIDKLTALSGKEFASLRRHVNRFYRLYPEIQFRDYMPADYQQTLALNRYWEETAGTKYKSIIDKEYFNAILKHYRELELIVLVAERKGEIVGVNIAGILPNGEAWGAICKTRKELEGLHEAIILKMVQKINALDPTIQRINVGSDMGREGLRRFKEKFKPVLDLERYRVYLKQAQP
jgi:hypothetical protein